MTIQKIQNKTIKYGILGLAMLGMLALGGCGTHGDAQEKAADKSAIRVMTTVFPLYDFVRQIGGEYVDVTLLLPPGVESHSYEPTPEDIIQISDSDLFLYVGGESDTWINTLLDGSLNKVDTLKAMDVVNLLEEEAVNHSEGSTNLLEAGGLSSVSSLTEGGVADGVPEKDSLSVQQEPEYDEHVWTSLNNSIAIVEKISEMLCTKDPVHKAQYEANTKAYIQQLQELDSRFRKVVQSGKRKTLIYGDRFPFRYFVEDYGLSYAAAFPGCSSETEPSAAILAELVKTINQEKIPVVLYLELSNHKIADALAETCHIKTAMFHSCHNVSKDEMQEGVTYLSLMESNLKVLEEALN